MERIDDARFVLIGEASHGTSEFYTWRAELSRRLIVEKGFCFVGVEGDWPDCYRVNRYVRGYPRSGRSAYEVLHAFDRWPTWMWANREVQEFTEWLRGHNDGREDEEKAGFYGLDVYSLWDSMRAVTDYLQRAAPELAPAARRAYACFDPYYGDVQDYARATRWTPESCEDEVVKVLAALRSHREALEDAGPEDYFNAEQNALVALNAERYYRTMVRGGPASWNLRDTHMADTLDRLTAHHGPKSKAIVWAHNTHVGDARATDMARDGMVNIGQLARERHAAEGVVLVGFGSHRGTVIAGREWEAPMEVMPVPPARTGSWEALFHEAGPEDRLMLLEEESAPEPFFETRGHRAIGVVYRPEFEVFGNYVPSVLPLRYDAFLHVDRTRALAPLHLPVREEHEVPETFPSGV
jgi:erythromycin esterase-like protein